MTGTGTAAPVAAGGQSLQPLRRVEVARWVIVVVVAAAVVLGILMRAWYLSHDPINSDEALIGIRARQILAGHLTAFLPGLRYEAVEPYLVAAVFGVFGSSATTLNVAVAVCDAAGCILVWRTARRLSQRGDVGAICAAGMWVAPQSAIWNSTMEYGFRGVTLVCGTAIVLLALRLYQGSSRWRDALVLGALFGVGFWSSPEIVYFALPSAIWTVGWLWRARGHPPELARRAAASVGGLLAAGVGALPWLWDNVTSGFPSLSASKYDLPSVVPPYAARLGDFFRGALPTVLDLRVPRSGAWDLPAVLGVLLVVVVGGAIAAAAGWQVWRHGDGTAIGIAVLAYPFVAAAAPVSFDWQSARYTNFFVPLVALLAAVSLGDALKVRRVGAPGGRRAHRRASAVLILAGLVMVAVIGTSVVAFDDLRAINVLRGSRLGASPDEPASRLASELEGAGVKGGYADYWVAYKLDFLTSGRLQITDTPPSPDRLASVRAAARALPAREQAWLFMVPTPTALTEYTDTAVIRGPSDLPLPTFLSDLKRLGVRYRLLHIAGAEAVVCARRVTPAEVGLRYPATGG
jgi:hypothetical protein